MDFYVVIPARYDSSRFPGKVLAQIGNKSMLEHVFLNAKKSNAKDVYIATDSEKFMTLRKVLLKMFILHLQIIITVLKE